MREPFVIDVEGVRKTYPGVTALDDARLRVRSGEVHGLVGENGAGKSTLIKILAGSVARDSGSIEIEGVSAQLGSEAEAYARGLRFIHQDVALVPRMTVAENLFLGQRMPHVGPFVARARSNAAAVEMLRGFLDVDPSRTLSSLSIAERWMVGIARACSGTPRLVVMDEPTVALADAEVERVFSAVERLRSDGIAVLFVSHRLGEILRIADSVTVMKDGRTVAHHEIADLDRTSLISLIVGEEGADLGGLDRPAAPRERIVLEVDRLSGGPVRDVSFQVRSGEILGIGGLVGSGRSSLLMTLFGDHRATSGHVKIDGATLDARSPRDAIAAGVAIIPEERRDQGLLMTRTVRENVVLSHLRDFRRARHLPFPDRGEETARVETEIAHLRIATTGPEQKVATLSGGNQQKVLLSRALVGRETKVLLLDEPTKGVDVGAKHEILQLIERLAADGVAVVIASSDLEEVAAIAHRVLVLREGRAVGCLDGPVTEEQILELCYASNEHDDPTTTTERLCS